MPSPLRRLVPLALPLLVAGPPGCSDSEPVPKGDEFATQSGAATIASVSPFEIPSLQTFIPESLQIDQLGTSAADGNLVLGNDVAGTTTSPSVCLPGGTGTCPATGWLDWNDLGVRALAKHRLVDASDPKGGDALSFPRANSCLGTSQVLSKMDLTWLGVASNQDFAYFAVQRADNSGAAAYYWLFTLKEPVREEAGPTNPCQAGEKYLRYDITGRPTDSGGNVLPGHQGDVLLVGRFQPSAGEPTVQVYVAKAPKSPSNPAQPQVWPGVEAVKALDVTNTALWQLQPSGLATAAVNTTPALAGSFGADKVTKTASGGSAGSKYVKEWIFAESALSRQVFTGGIACGAQFYGSVVTFPSGSGTSPDLKDFSVGKFDFGSIAIEPVLTPTCEAASFAYSVSATYAGTLAVDLSNAVCQWDFDSNGTIDLTSCAPGTRSVTTQGSQKVTVHVTIGGGCADTKVAYVDAWDPLKVSANLGATCGQSFQYAGTVSGGNPLASPAAAWSFSGAEPVTVASLSGQQNVQTSGAYKGLVKATDKRTSTSSAGVTTSLTCTASAEDSVQVYPPLAVSASLQAGCGLSASYAASVTGGSSPATTPVAWTFSSAGGVPSPASSIDLSGTFAVSTGGVVYQAAVTATDPRTDLDLQGQPLVCTASAKASTTPYAPVAIQLTLTPSCKPQFDYGLQVTASDGTGLVDLSTATCDWDFDGDQKVDLTSCQGGTRQVLQGFGPQAVSVLVTLPGGCSATATDTVQAWPELTATAQLTGTCSLTFDHAVTVAGGSSPATAAVSWSFSGPGLTVPLISAVRDGQVSVTAGGSHEGLVAVSDPRADVLCTVEAKASTAVYAPLKVQLDRLAAAGTCPTMNGSAAGDAVGWQAKPDGGNGQYTLTWSGCPAVQGSTCTVDPAEVTYCSDASVQVTLQDSSGLCPAVKSEIETYGKVTTLTASDH